MSRLNTAIKHTKYSERGIGGALMPKECIIQHLSQTSFISCPAAPYYNNHCNNRCPWDRTNLLDKVLEELDE